MSTIYSNGTFLNEVWKQLADEAAVPENGAIVVPFNRFLETPEIFIGRAAPVAVLIEPGDKVEDLAAQLPHLSKIFVAFPKFTDGRGFSAARVLREQLGYEGDIRATGDYILDQVPLMRRCGVSSFEIAKPDVAKALESGAWTEVTRYLQPVGSTEEIPVGTRPWARISRAEFTAAAQ